MVLAAERSFCIGLDDPQFPAVPYPLEMKPRRKLNSPPRNQPQAEGDFSFGGARQIQRGQGIFAPMADSHARHASLCIVWRFHFNEPIARLVTDATLVREVPDPTRL